ncbi:MAG: hypothetical protein ABIH38_00250 [Patescibacteria group bacterium]
MDQMEQNTPPVAGPGGISRQKNMLYLLFTFIILIALGVGAYFYFFQGEGKGDKNNNNSERINNNEISGNSAADNAVNVSKAQGDEDRDGLSDTEEKELGTDPQKSDTDTDGLSDYEEVNVYKTDPLKADTDGDSHLDGVEVSNGYDPNGTGELLNLNEAINNLNTNN